MEKNQPRAATRIAIEFACAFGQAEKARKALFSISWPNPINLSVPEIGTGCCVADKAALQTAINTHIAHTSMGGCEQLAFRKRMASYVTAMELLTAQYAEWRASSGVDAIEELDTHAYERKEKAWKALMAFAKSNPREIPVLAQAVGAHELMEPWRMREFLKIVGKGARL